MGLTSSKKHAAGLNEDKLGFVRSTPQPQVFATNHFLS